MSPGVHRLTAAICQGCGKEFMVRVAVLASGRGRFCSRSCAKSGANSPVWKGGRTVTTRGYVKSATGSSGGRSEHLVVAERALGHPLPGGVEVHHFNEDKGDNSPSNLVICQDREYHQFLHTLRRVQLAGGRPFLDLVCSVCQRPKQIDEFPIRSQGKHRTTCRPCIATQQRNRRDHAQETACTI